MTNPYRARALLAQPEPPEPQVQHQGHMVLNDQHRQLELVPDAPNQLPQLIKLLIRCERLAAAKFLPANALPTPETTND